MPKSLFRLVVSLFLVMALYPGGWPGAFLGGPVPALAQPAAAPDFQLSTVEGKPISLSQYRGRVVVLDFFATWCSPCVGAMPHLNELNEAYRDKGLSVIGYSLDDGGRRVLRPFAARMNLGFPLVVGTSQEAKDVYGVQALPTTIIIDPQGREVTRFVGAVGKSRIQEAVQPYLSGHAADPPDSALVVTRKKGDRRLGQVWITRDEIFQGRAGLLVHVAANVADLTPQRGLWLALNLTPTIYGPGGGKPVGETLKLYKRVDDASIDRFILFVACDQLPKLPQNASYRSWVTLVGPDLKSLEEGDEFWLTGVCAAPRPSRAENMPPGQPPAVTSPAKDRGPIGRSWLVKDYDHDGKRGFLVYVGVDLASGSLGGGLWLCVNLKAKRGDGRVVKLYRRITGTEESQYALFVGCDQLPPGDEYEVWVTMVGRDAERELGRSDSHELASPCRLASSGTRPLVTSPDTVLP